MLVIIYLFWICLLFICYVYVGYPVIIYLLSLLKHEKNYAFSNKPKISLIIAAYNEEEIIIKKIENVLDQKYPKDLIEIIIATDGSTDSTIEKVKAMNCNNVKISFIPERKGKMAALCNAIKIATADLVIFSDANCMFKEDALFHLIVPFSDENIGMVCGSKNILKSNNSELNKERLYWKYENFIKSAESRFGNCLSASGEILAIRKSLFTYREEVINDDFFLLINTINKGKKIVYAPKAIAYEEASIDLQEERIRRTRMAAGRYQALFKFNLLPVAKPILLWQIFSHKYARLIIPFAMLGLLVSLFLTAIIEFFIKTPTILLIKYSIPFNKPLLFIYCFTLIVAFNKNCIFFKFPIFKVFSITTFLISSNFAVLMGFFQFLFGKQNHVWKKSKRIYTHTYNNE